MVFIEFDHISLAISLILWVYKMVIHCTYCTVYPTVMFRGFVWVKIQKNLICGMFLTTFHPNSCDICFTILLNRLICWHDYQWFVFLSFLGIHVRNQKKPEERCNSSFRISIVTNFLHCIVIQQRSTTEDFLLADPAMVGKVFIHFPL